jgi:hypothetical protein
METNETPVPAPTTTQESVVAEAMTDKQMLAEIYENTRKTKNYMKWQLYITIILVVIPLLAAIFIVPFAFNSLSSSYGSLLQ